MELIADGLLIAAAATAALYCWVLSRRLNALKSLDSGLGGAIASLSRQVDETRASLSEVKTASREQSRDLRDLTDRAEVATQKLEAALAVAETRETSADIHDLKSSASPERPRMRSPARAGTAAEAVRAWAGSNPSGRLRDKLTASLEEGTSPLDSDGTDAARRPSKQANDRPIGNTSEMPLEATQPSAATLPSIQRDPEPNRDTGRDEARSALIARLRSVAAGASQ
ncbi:MAG: hypothetical protein AAGI50_08095 [Pseudomonadota bacterium]